MVFCAKPTKKTKRRNGLKTGEKKPPDENSLYILIKKFFRTKKIQGSSGGVPTLLPGAIWVQCSSIGNAAIVPKIFDSRAES